MKKNNLFILRSPLQIINAIEAIEQFNLKNNILVLIFNSLDTNTKQIDQLVSLHKWEQIIRLEDRGRSKLFKYVKLVNSLKKQSFKYMFFGNLGTIQKILLANLKKEFVYMLDDGTSTIMYYDKYIKVSRVNKYNLRELRFLIFGLKIKVKDKINFFTYFNLEQINGIKVIKNNFEKLKSRSIKREETSKEIYFIGQPLDDVNVLSIDDYVSVLNGISRLYDKKITYIPHRSESIELKKSIENIDENIIEIIKLDTPVELYFLEKNIYPSIVISFFSTALSTLKIIFDNVDIKVIEIPFEKIDNKDYYYDFLENYYRGINDSKIITFKELNLC